MCARRNSTGSPAQTARSCAAGAGTSRMTCVATPASSTHRTARTTIGTPPTGRSTDTPRSSAATVAATRTKLVRRLRTSTGSSRAQTTTRCVAALANTPGMGVGRRLAGRRLDHAITSATSATTALGVGGGQDLVEQQLGPALVGALGQRELAHEDLPRLGEHALLARGQATVLLAPPQIAHDLGDLVHITGRQLLEVGLVPARPVGGLLGVRGAQHLEHPIQALLPDDIANPDDFGVLSGHLDGEIALGHLQDQVLACLSLDRPGFDRLDESGTVVRVDNGLSDLENHVSLAPFAGTRLTRLAGGDSGGMRCRCRSGP